MCGSRFSLEAKCPQATQHRGTDVVGLGWGWAAGRGASALRDPRTQSRRDPRRPGRSRRQAYGGCVGACGVEGEQAPFKISPPPPGGRGRGGTGGILRPPRVGVNKRRGLNTTRGIFRNKTPTVGTPPKRSMGIPPDGGSNGDSIHRSIDTLPNVSNVLRRF